MSNDESFDAVQMMREIRDALSRRYEQDPEAQRRDLQRIEAKYGVRQKLGETPVHGAAAAKASGRRGKKR
jgi:hypothetical protein